jgi:hypothetical protein
MLRAVTSEAEAAGAIAVQTDVSGSFRSRQLPTPRTPEFGGVHVLCNNGRAHLQ